MRLINKIIKKIWIDKAEEDIHECIIEAYTHKNFQVYNDHKNRSRSEKGIDITCSKDGQKIIFQVKKKPGATDIKQLQEFSKQDADERIYVYIDAPTTDFKKEMGKFESVVQFWDKFRLHDVLVEYNSFQYLYYLLKNTDLVNNITKVLKIFVKSRTVDYNGIARLTNDHYNMLWRMKDDSVKLNANLQLCCSYWKETLKKETSTDPKNEKEILEKILLNLEQINEIAGEKIGSTFESCEKRSPWILSYGYKVAVKNLSSNWIGFYPPHKDLEKDKILEDNIKQWLIPAGEGYGFYCELTDILNQLYERAEAIEDFIDWTFKDYNKPSKVSEDD